MINNLYSTQKILHHPEVLCNLKNKIPIVPIQIHLMPQNTCNHNCTFCSYRIQDNKNNQKFDSRSSIPEKVMLRLLSDLYKMGVKAIELTGGGEPLLYPYKDIMFEHIIGRFDYSLVTNGTLLTEELSRVIAPQMTWARISIDAGNKDTYSRVRNVSDTMFSKALNGVSFLRRWSQHPEFKLGVGFVVTNENFREIYDACKLAKEHGADNVRISAVFHPDGISYFKENVIEIGTQLAKKAEELNDSNFIVYNLFDERIHNLKLKAQDYKFCGTKELLCVIGGDCNVYTCCSLAFNDAGLIGSIRYQSFKELWESNHKKNMFADFDASAICKYGCLYEKRNKFINSLLEEPMHVNFI